MVSAVDDNGSPCDGSSWDARVGCAQTHLRASAVAGCLAIFLAGCASPDSRLPVPESIQEAATVQVAPISISRWEDNVQRLQPNFSMTEATALSLAVPRTSISQNATASVQSASLQLGLPTSTTTASGLQSTASGSTSGQGANGSTSASSTQGQTTGNGVTTSNASTSNTSTTTTSTTTMSTTDGTTTQTISVQRGPGTAPSSPLPAISAPNASTLTGPTGTIAMDPFLTYKAGAAVFDEVAMLNTFVLNAAQRRGYVPYLARIQVSLAPLAHYMRYDAYVNMSLFSSCDVEYRNSIGNPVIVVPLLVTDDVESGQSTKIASLMRQLGLALGGTVSNVALQAAVASLKSEIDAELANDFNSLYMVSRVTENTIRLRFGAATNAKSGYAMLTQTHDVSVLLLVKKSDTPETPQCGTPQVAIHTATQLRDASTGKELAPNTQLIAQKVAGAVNRVFALKDKEAVTETDAPAISALFEPMQTGEKEGFEQALCGIGIPSVKARLYADGGCNLMYARSLWVALAPLMNMSEFSSASLQLPTSVYDVKRPHSEAHFLSDDCSTTLSTTVDPLGGLKPKQTDARLRFLDKSGTRVKLELKANSLTQDADGAPLKVVWPSLATVAVLNSIDDETIQDIRALCPASSPKGKVARKGGEDDLPPTGVLRHVLLTVSGVDDLRWSDGQALNYGDVYEHVYAVGAKPKASDASKSNSGKAPAVSIKPVTSVIQSAGGGGTIRLQISLGAGVDDAILTMSGGELSAPLPGNATPREKPPEPAASLVIAKSGYVDVTLSGLVPGHAIKFTLTGRTGGEPAPKAVATASVSVSKPAQISKAQ